MDNEIYEASNTIKDANLKTLARMVVDYMEFMTRSDMAGIEADFEESMKRWAAICEFSESILKDTE